MDLHIFAFILLLIFTIEIVFVFIMGASKIRGKPDLTFPGPPPSIFPRPPPMPRPFPGPRMGVPPGPWPMRPGMPGNRPIHRPGHGGPGHGGPGGKLHDLESVTFYLEGKDDFEKTLNVKNKSEFNVDFTELLKEKYKDDTLMLKYQPRNTKISWSLGSLSGDDNRSPVSIDKVEKILEELGDDNNIIFKLTNKVR